MYVFCQLSVGSRLLIARHLMRCSWSIWLKVLSGRWKSSSICWPKFLFYARLREVCCWLIPCYHTRFGRTFWAGAELALRSRRVASGNWSYVPCDCRAVSGERLNAHSLTHSSSYFVWVQWAWLRDFVEGRGLALQFTNLQAFCHPNRPNRRTKLGAWPNQSTVQTQHLEWSCK